MATSSETYPLTLPTSENLPLSSYGLSVHNKHKHVRLGIVIVQICNPITGQSTNIYTFQDSGSQLTLLRKSVAEEIGLHGTPHIQSCQGMHATTSILVESADIQIRGIHETDAFNMTDVEITETVPELEHSLLGTLGFEEHENFCVLNYPNQLL